MLRSSAQLLGEGHLIDSILHHVLLDLLNLLQLRWQVLVRLCELEARLEVDLGALLHLVLSNHLLHIVPVLFLLHFLFIHARLSIASLEVLELKFIFLPEAAVVERRRQLFISWVRLFANVGTCLAWVNFLTLKLSLDVGLFNQAVGLFDPVIVRAQEPRVLGVT